MTRHAVIITNPGEKGADNYCPGVLVDKVNYTSFLTSSIGGYWYQQEIVTLDKPSTSELRQEIARWKYYDYVMVVFSGHGYYSEQKRSTILELQNNQEINSSELYQLSGKRTIILDCCRVRVTIPILERKAVILDHAISAIHPDRCRKYYDASIAECADELVVMYSCGIGESAGDNDRRGGTYSSNLIESSKQWANSLCFETSNSHRIISVLEAHRQAEQLVLNERGPRQTPDITKPRSGPYFPFCVVA